MTTNNTLPPAIRGKYELTRSLKGGPVFAFPRHGLGNIDFSAITERQCESLIRRGWHGIRKIEPKPEPAPEPRAIAAPAEPKPEQAVPDKPRPPATTPKSV